MWAAAAPTTSMDTNAVVPSPCVLLPGFGQTPTSSTSGTWINYKATVLPCGVGLRDRDCFARRVRWITCRPVNVAEVSRCGAVQMLSNCITQFALGRRALIILVLTALVGTFTVQRTSQPKRLDLPPPCRVTAAAARDQPLNVAAVTDRLLQLTESDHDMDPKTDSAPDGPLNSDVVAMPSSPAVAWNGGGIFTFGFRFGPSRLATPAVRYRIRQLFLVRQPSSAPLTVLRYPTFSVGQGPRDGSYEHHRDQTLASLAELGLPLSLPLMVEGQEHCLRDVLADSLANFHLRQAELEWTAVAYALYLPPHRRWHNRFGEEFTFELLCAELMDRPLSEASCTGLHLLHTLTVLHCVHQHTPILSDERASLLEGYLRTCVRHLSKQQCADGSWAPNWQHGLFNEHSHADSESVEHSRNDKVLVTGHIAEWMLRLPPDMRLEATSLRSAAGWLLRAMQLASPEDLRERFCPYTHAAVFLDLISRGSSQAAVGGNT